MPTQTLQAEHLDALVTALLAVNGHPAEKVWKALPDFHAAGLMDPDLVSTEDLGTLTVKLASNGYNRGMLTGMMAERYQALMRSVSSGTLDALPALMRTEQKSEALALLQTVKGIGPMAARLAWSILGGRK